MASSAVAFVTFLAHALASTQSSVVQAVCMDVTNVFVGTVCFDLNAINSIAIITRSANALVPVMILVQLAIGERMAVVHDIARNYDFKNLR